MREDPAQPERDRLGLAQILGHAVGPQPREQRRHPLIVSWVAPLDRARLVCDPREVRVAIRGLVKEHAVEQQLDSDVCDGAARTAGTVATGEGLVELAHQAGDRWQHVKRGIRGVVEVDAGGEIDIARRGHPRARHRGEIGKHRAEDHASPGCGLPARDRGVPEVVHASYYHLPVLVVGIDLGTQSCKAVVCDEQLTVLGTHAVPLTTQHPQRGWAEQDPRAWDAALAPAIAGALANSNKTPRDIVALAIVGQLDGCVAVDRDGAPLHPCLIWQDRRAIDEALRAPADQFSLTGQVADPGHLAPKAAWLRAHGIGAARFHQPVSYLVQRLTGEAMIDLALASSCMLLDLANRRWAPALLDAFELAIEQLPSIRATCDVAALTADGARLTGLPVGIAVAVGTGDDFASPLGAGLTRPGPIAVTLGTAEVVGAIARQLVLDPAPEPMVETHAYPTGAFFVENPGWLSGAAVEWAVALLGVPDAAALDALATAAPPGADGVIFVPALAGAMTPVWRPHARGTFHGLSPDHGREHLARAVLEGLAFACRDVVERLTAMKLAAERVVLVGGGAHSTLWSQLRADAIGLRHDVIANPDTSPIGAAMIASVAAGIHADLETAAALVAPTHVTYHPQTHLDEAYARYRRLVAALASLSASRW